MALSGRAAESRPRSFVGACLFLTGTRHPDLLNLFKVSFLGISDCSPREGVRLIQLDKKV